MKIIETHCHLDYLKQMSLDDILNKSLENNIEKIITISVQPSNMDPVFEIANKYSNVFCSQGIHPHHANEYNDEVTTKILKRAKENKVIAVGEIGLDYYYNHSPREKQIEVFETQLQLACDLNLPVIIHTRDADEDTNAILKNFSSLLKSKGVIHSFTSGRELAEFAISEGFKIGFNGIITFKKADNVREIVELTPVQNILFETDAPFLTPVPHRGKENAPFYLPHIADAIGKLKNINVNELSEVVYNNSKDLFKL